MDISILLTLLCYLLLLTKTTTTCTSAKCNDTRFSPEIRFPFRLIEALQPQEWGLPRFNLFCKKNTTMIHLPNYKILQVKSITYDIGQTRLDLVDPSNCVHEVFLNLNLSLTPFTYYYHVHRYKYINCTTQLRANSLQQVPCLSASNYHVYVVRPSFSTPVSCRVVRSVKIPFGYSPYISDHGSFGLALTWSSTRLDEEEEEEKKEEASVGIVCAQTWHLMRKYLRAAPITKYLVGVYAVTGIIAFAFIMGKLLYASLSKYHHQFNKLKVKKTLGQEEIDKLLHTML